MKSLLVALALGLAATSAIAAELPKSVKDAGAIKIAITPNYPPLEFRDPATNELTGLDVDLAAAIAAKLGVKVDWQETSFSEMLSALKTGRVDLIMSGMTDLASRHDGATFVDYLKSGPQFFIQASRASEFPDMAALCGKKVGASRRTSFPKEIAAWSDKNCASNPIQVVGTNGSADARTQLKQGRIDAAVQGNETLPYVMSQEPDAYKALGKPIAYQFTGIAVPIDEKGFQKSISGALDALIADGTYQKLLAKWNLKDSAVEKASLNAGQ